MEIRIEITCEDDAELLETLALASIVKGMVGV